MVESVGRQKVDYDREVRKRLIYNNLLEMMNLTRQSKQRSIPTDAHKRLVLLY